MPYQMQYVNHGRIKIDDDNYKRLTKPSRTMGERLFAPMNDKTTLIFYHNITMIIPDSVQVYSHSWENSPHVVEFTDGYRLGITENDVNNLKNTMKGAGRLPYIRTDRGVLVFHSKVAMITSIDSSFIKEKKVESCCDTNSEVRSFLNKKENIQYINQCTGCGKKGKLVKTNSIDDPGSVKPVLEM